jgi:DNA invertase Pin-like site-specific DNA recombinase
MGRDIVAIGAVAVAARGCVCYGVSRFDTVKVRRAGDQELAMAKKKTRTKDSKIAKLAEKLGVAESTIRARRTRGTKLDAKPQVRTTAAQQRQIVAAKGTTEEVAAKFGVSISTVKRLRRVFKSKRK